MPVTADVGGRSIVPSNSSRPLTRGPGASVTMTSAMSRSPTASGISATSVASGGNRRRSRRRRRGRARDGHRAAGRDTDARPSSGLTGGRGTLTTRSTYCPAGTAANVNAPLQSVIVVATSRGWSASSAAAGRRTTPVVAPGPSGAMERARHAHASDGPNLEVDPAALLAGPDRDRASPAPRTPPPDRRRWDTRACRSARRPASACREAARTSDRRLSSRTTIPPARWPIRCRSTRDSAPSASRR